MYTVTVLIHDVASVFLQFSASFAYWLFLFDFLYIWETLRIPGRNQRYEERYE